MKDVVLLDTFKLHALSFYMSVFFALTLVASLFSCFCMRVAATHGDHLVVLSHGIHGSKTDLTYLSQQLEKVGCVVLRSSSNEFLKSQSGIESGAKNLKQEILSMLSSNAHLKRISFVGNSLGGLYTRYVARELYDKSSGLMAGLSPHYFLVGTFFVLLILKYSSATSILKRIIVTFQ